MAVALENLRGARRRLQPEPLARDPLQLRVGRGVRADGAREFADAQALESARDARAGAVELERPSSELEPERRRLGVDAVGAPDANRVLVLFGARDDGCKRAVDAAEELLARRTDLERERGVDDVGGGEAVVEPAALVAELLGDGIDECRGVVLQRRLELGHALGGRRARPLPDGPGGLGRDCAQLGPGVERRDFHLEPGRQPALVRPDPGHGRARVAGDHQSQSRARPGRRSSRTVATRPPPRGECRPGEMTIPFPS